LAATESKSPELSERESEILRLVATGASNKEIAQQLFISPNTVKVHLRNIFAKISVVSRTEATLYAIRQGIVQLPVTPETAPFPASSEANADSLAQASFPIRSPAAPSAPNSKAGLRNWRPWIALGLGVFVVTLALGLLWWRASTDSRILPSIAPSSTPVRWQARASLPSARSGLAVAVYENQIYAIGGETLEGVSDQLERYDPVTDTWAKLASKPSPVADINAVVIGGHIYVPGGRRASGEATNVLEVYDPRQDQWNERAPLPASISAYALAAFEGRLYLFGGWNGQSYSDLVYQYDPSQDAWKELTAMPSPRGYAGAAVAGGKIYIIGGINGQEALATNEQYEPEAEAQGENPWRSRAPLPEARYGLGVASIADIIYVIGGQGEAQTLASFGYLPQQDQWQKLELPLAQPWSGLGLAAVETILHAFGGKEGLNLTTAHMTYQAIYTISIPVLP
jgi:DNA-binding CsgD family transcriptional regulator